MLLKSWLSDKLYSLDDYDYWPYIGVIPQGTVDNNLGPDRLAGTKALDPNYCRQPTLRLHNLCLEVLTVHGIKLRLFLGQGIPPTHTINVAHLT